MILRTLRSGAGLAIAAVAALIISAFFSAPVDILPALVLAGFTMLAVYSPGNALLVLAAFGPIATSVHILLGAPYDADRLFEVAVVAVCGGAALHWSFRRSTRGLTAFELAAAVFSAVVLISCLAQMPVAFVRMGLAEPEDAARLLLRDYFAHRPAHLGALWQSAVLLEGVALGVITARIARAPEMRSRLAQMCIAGGAAAAALNLQRLLEVALRNPPVGEALLHSLASFRFNTQFRDVNAAGSYFAMVAILCFSAATDAGHGPWRRAIHRALFVLIACGLWTSGSRVALIVTALCSAAIGIARTRPLRPGSLNWRTAAVAAAVLAAVFVGALFLFPVHRHGAFRYSVFTRVELLQTGARMWLDRPITGIGTSQFYAQFPHYASPELLAAFREATGVPITHENAHNQYVQFLAELGIAGFAAFVAILAAALAPRPVRPDWSHTGAVIAIGGFLVTALAGHPLLIPIVACSFWLVLGLAASAAPPLPDRLQQRLGFATVVLSVLLVLTLPVRWRLERNAADLGAASIGLSKWERDEDGTRFRWASHRATLFVTSDARSLRLPLKSPDSSSRSVEISLDGRPAAVLQVPPGVWVDARLLLPASDSAPAFRRVDLKSHFGSSGPTGDPDNALMVGRADVLLPESQERR